MKPTPLQLFHAILPFLFFLASSALADPPLTLEEQTRLRAEEERKMADTAHLLIVHAKGERGPLASTTEEQRKTACLRAYAALRQCLPDGLRNAEDERFFAARLQESLGLKLVNKVVEPTGATEVLGALQNCSPRPSPTQGSIHIPR